MSRKYQTDEELQAELATLQSRVKEICGKLQSRSQKRAAKQLMEFLAGREPTAEDALAMDWDLVEAAGMLWYKKFSGALDDAFYGPWNEQRTDNDPGRWPGLYHSGTWPATKQRRLLITMNANRPLEEQQGPLMVLPLIRPWVDGSKVFGLLSHYELVLRVRADGGAELRSNRDVSHEREEKASFHGPPLSVFESVEAALRHVHALLPAHELDE